MGSFILAGLIFLGFVAMAVLTAFAQGMSDAPRYDNAPRNIFMTGCVVSGLIAASHWMPNIGW